MTGRKFGLFAVGLLLGIAPMLMAPTGGLPSRPTFSAVTVRSGGTLTVNGVSLTPETGTGTLTFTGYTVTQTPAFSYVKIGNIVTLRVDVATTGTSNSTAMTASAASLPASIRPVTALCVTGPYGTDNSANFAAPTMVRVDTAGGLNFDKGGGNTCAAASWTAAGTKTIAPFTITYTLQ